MSPIKRKVVRKFVGNSPSPPVGPMVNQAMRARGISFMSWAINNACRDGRYWIRHETPKCIEVKGADLCHQFRKGGKLSADTCDAFFRRSQEADVGEIGSSIIQSPRHWVETDFAEAVLRGKDYTKCRAVQQIFIGGHILHDVSQCSQIVALARHGGNWCALVWNTHFKQVTIFARGATSNGFDVTKDMEDLMDNLHGAMERCAAQLFNGWEIDWQWWPKLGVDASDLGGIGDGIQALAFCKMFTGSNHAECRAMLAADFVDVQAAEIMYDLLHLRHNTGQLPDEFLESNSSS